MNRSYWIFGCIAVQMAGVAPLIAEQVVAQPASASGGSASLELAILTDKGPCRLQIEVARGGRSQAELWDDNFAALANYFDFNGDGALDEDESKLLPSALALREVLGCGIAPPLGKSPLWKELDPDQDGKAVAKELAEFYRRAGLGQPSVGAGVIPASASLTDALLRAVDRDSNQQTDESEWRASAGLVRQFDRNDDELVGAGELVAAVLYPGAAGDSALLPPSAHARPLSPALQHLPLIVLPPSEADTYWAAAVAARYDRDGDGQLEASEIPQGLAALDEDRDGTVSVGEIAAWRKAKPDACWRLCLAENAADRPWLEECCLTGREESTPESAKASELSFSRDGLRLIVCADQGRLADEAAAAQKQYLEQFGKADANHDGFVEAGEAPKALMGFWTALAQVVDRDRDSKTSKAELDAWLKLQNQLTQGQVLLTVLDGGAGIFELLDVDHDNALSVRELRGAWDRLREAECIVDGRLDRTRLPRLLLGAASHGYPRSRPGRRLPAGPAWFQSMDRNGDGDVSTREFVGDRAQFQRLDRDHDDLLSASEAASVAP